MVLYRRRKSSRRRIPMAKRILRPFQKVLVAFFRFSLTKRIIIAGSVVVAIAAFVLLLTLPSKSVEVVAQNTNEVQSIDSTGVAGVTTTEPSPDSSASPSPEPSPTPDPTLKKGDENDRVQQLQERLMDLGYMDIDESTKLFGPATKQAVEYFQRQHGLPQDGIAGPDTLNLIFSDQAKKYTLLQGTRGEDVNSLQRQLIDLGYLQKSTGYYGDETVASVKEFQKRNNLAVDGKTGQDTLDLIYSPKAKPSASKVQAERRKANINKMIQVAQKQLGKPYVGGHEGPNSFDCSGLVYYCLKQAGSSRGRYNAAGYSVVDEWQEVPWAKLQKGDLLFFHVNHKRIGHVGIYIGDGMMIDASSSNGKVVKRSCTTPYWRKAFVNARRPW